MTNYLITGCAGFIGSNLAEKLLKKRESYFGEINIQGIDNFSTGKLENIPDGVMYSKQDIGKKIYLPEDFKIDVIFHLAGQSRINPSFSNPSETCQSNIQGTINVLELAKEHNAKVIYAGSSSFYFDPYANPYSFSKWAGEECCKMYNKVFNVSVAIARFFNVYGPRQICEGEFATVMGIFESLKKQNKSLTITGNGNKRRDFIHVDDVCSGLIAMAELKWNGEVFNLGTGRNYSILELAQMFQPIGIEHIQARPGEAEQTLADISFSLENLNWKPEITLESYIQNNI